MASLATFDGQGFGSRNMSQCTFTPTSRSGDTWNGSQTCTDSYSKERLTEALSITVASDSRFTQENGWGRGTYNLCPNVKLSDYTG